MKKRLLQQARGFTIIEALIAAALIAGIALAVVQVTRDSGNALKTNFMQNARVQTLAYFTGITREAANRALTQNHADNGTLKSYATNATFAATIPAVVPSTIDLTNLDPATGLPSGMRPLALYRSGPAGSAVLEVPAGGLYLKNNGQRCPELSLPASSCDPTKASFHVKAAWIPLGFPRYEVQILVDQVNRGKTDVALKTVSSATLDQNGYWAGSGSSIFNTNGGNVGINNQNPGSALDVTGDISFSGRALAGTAVDAASAANVLTTKVYVDNNKTSFASQGTCPPSHPVLSGFDASGNKVCIPLVPPPGTPGSPCTTSQFPGGTGVTMWRAAVHGAGRVCCGVGNANGFVNAPWGAQHMYCEGY